MPSAMIKTRKQTGYEGTCKPAVKVASPFGQQTAKGCPYEPLGRSLAPKPRPAALARAGALVVVVAAVVAVLAEAWEVERSRLLSFP